MRKNLFTSKKFWFSSAAYAVTMVAAGTVIGISMAWYGRVLTEVINETK